MVSNRGCRPVTKHLRTDCAAARKWRSSGVGNFGRTALVEFAVASRVAPFPVVLVIPVPGLKALPPGLVAEPARLASGLDARLALDVHTAHESHAVDVDHRAVRGSLAGVRVLERAENAHAGHVDGGVLG